MKPNCIDVSTWNGAVDYHKVKAAGVKAVIIRAGFGNSASQVDNRFEQNYKNAKAAGLKIGIYWYSYSDGVADSEREAKACLSVLGGKKLELPIYYDMEEASIAQLGKSTCTAMAERFCDTVKKAGFKPGVYANPNWFINYLNYDALKKKYSIWLAQWAGSHSLACDIWQYGDDGKISGVSGSVDVDVIENAALLNDKSSDKGEDKQDKSSAVATVQRWLNTHFHSGLAVDGIYGNHTKAALVKALQTTLGGLTVDGIFGAKTKAKVKNLSVGSTGKLVYILQGLLICHGYDTGGFDGVFGAKTKAAVEDFQRRHALVRDGIAGRETFAKLCA